MISEDNKKRMLRRFMLDKDWLYQHFNGLWRVLEIDKPAGWIKKPEDKDYITDDDEFDYSAIMRRNFRDAIKKFIREYEPSDFKALGMERRPEYDDVGDSLEVGTSVFYGDGVITHYREGCYIAHSDHSDDLTDKIFDNFDDAKNYIKEQNDAR